MQVKLVSITQSLVEGEIMTAEQLVVYAARISNPSNQMNHETAPRLIAYLLKNKHYSPFEQVHLSVEIKTSRAIAAQILRHWSMRFQEYSQRYAEVTEMEPVQLRRQGATNRQSSEEVFDPEIRLKSLLDGMVESGPASVFIENYLQYGQNLYRKLLKAEVAKECARMILPLTTQTTMIMNGSVRDWLFYLTARTDAHAQLEHRQVAEAIKEIFVQYFPNISAALWNQPQHQ